MQTMPVLDRLVAVNLDVRIWSGRKKLTAEDLSLGADVPPEDLVSLGSKRVCDPDAIKVFHRITCPARSITRPPAPRIMLATASINAARDTPLIARLAVSICCMPQDEAEEPECDVF
jgi:hypothetical protein